jgi:hypothetical protein
VGGDWLDQHTSQAPSALRARVHQYTRAVPTVAGSTLSNTLVTAGQTALARVLAHPGDRSAALDLLAADALVTLALQYQAQTAPERLEEFATSVLQTTRPDE